MKIQKKDLVFPVSILSVVAGGLLLIDCIIFSSMLGISAEIMPTALIVFLIIFLTLLYLCSLGLIAMFFLIYRCKIISQLKALIITLLSVAGSVMVLYLIVWTLLGENTSSLASMVFLLCSVILGFTIYWLSFENKNKE